MKLFGVRGKNCRKIPLNLRDHFPAHFLNQASDNLFTLYKETMVNDIWGHFENIQFIVLTVE